MSSHRPRPLRLTGAEPPHSCPVRHPYGRPQPLPNIDRGGCLRDTGGAGRSGQKGMLLSGLLDHRLSHDLPRVVDSNQINFRVPPGISPGMATLQMIAAWIPNSPVLIAIP